jgi:phenylalanyl-tRNA synthetase alpha subunit
MADEQTTTVQDNPVQETPILGSGASENQDWRSSLTDELKNNPTIQNIKDLESAANTLVHQQKMIGSRIPIPKTEEEKAELYTKLGRPETSEKYNFTIPETHSKYFNEEQVNQFKNVAHQIGLNNDQTKALIDFQVKSIDFEQQRRDSDMTLGKKNTEELLHKEWGYDYDNKIRAAKRAMSVYADNELIDLLDTDAGNHPSVVKLFARLGEDITEEMAKNTQNNRLAVSPIDAKADIAKIYADAKHPYHDAGHPEHRNAVDQVRQLHEKVYGN